MKIPEKLKISGRVFSVGLANLNTNEKVYGGQSSLFKQWIKIQCDMPQTQKEETLLHEVIELINAMNDLGLNHTQISTLSSSLYQVVEDNKN